MEVIKFRLQYLFFEIFFMRKGHRRTQSDTFASISTLTGNIRPLKKRNTSEIPNIIKQTTRKTKTKTVVVETLEQTHTRSYQDLMFYFGRKGHDMPTGTSTQFDEEPLLSIPEVRPHKYTSANKNVKHEHKKSTCSIHQSRLVSPCAESGKSSKFFTSPVKHTKKVSHDRLAETRISEIRKKQKESRPQKNRLVASGIRKN